MRYRQQTRRALGAAVLVCGLSLAITGCESAGRAHLKGAGAPGLRESREMADPNAPFSVRGNARPHLATREPVLDVQAVPVCAPAALSLFESGAQSNGNRHTVRFSLSNSGEACKLGGFPAVSLLRADGSVMGDIRVKRIAPDALAATLAKPGSATGDGTLDAPSLPVLLPARGEAAFQLGWATGPECDQVSRIAIAAPGSSRSILIARPMVVCESEILVTPVSAE